MKHRFNDPKLEILSLMGGMPNDQLEIVLQYLNKFKSAYAEKAKEQNGTEAKSSKA